MAVDVTTDGPKYVSKHVECSAPEEQLRLESGKSRQTIKHTRRGRGGGKNQGKIIKAHYFSILGTNDNGLKAKQQSLINTVNFFNKPSVITIQESKLRHNRIIKLDGYQIFEMNRPGLGGGLLTAARHELEPVLVYRGNEEAGILVIQTQVGYKKVRIFNAYGPQEDVGFQTKFEF